MRSQRIVAACCLACISTASWLGPARAQSNGAGQEAVQIHGVLLDLETRERIAGATISVVAVSPASGTSWSGHTDREGRFLVEVPPLGSYRLAVQAPLFQSVSHILVVSGETGVDVRVEMARVGYALDPIIVTARRRSRLEREGFYVRRDSGTGHFIAREDIEAQSPSTISDVFRGIPGVRVLAGGSGQSAVVRLRGGCTPAVVFDGVRMSNPVPIDEMFPVSGVEGVEVYHGSLAPMEYAGRTNCGLIMIWSRDPNDRGEGRGLTWKRALIGVGIAGLIVLGAR